MKINYPIKYAAMPIIEQVGWFHGLHELQRDYDVVCYIVSKCHLINDLTKYTKNGCAIKEYEVVFPYQQAEFSRWKRVIPEYNLIHGYCINSNKVDKIFNSYEEALDYVTNKNEKICEKSWEYTPFSNDILDKIHKIKNDFDDKLSEYKILEQQIIINTDDMKIGENKELKNVIKLENKTGKLLSCSIYEVLQLFDKDKFVVYNISQEQYNVLMQPNGLDNIKSIIGSTQDLLLYKTKKDFIKLAPKEDCGTYYFKDNKIYNDPQMNKITKEDFENIDEDTLIFYTTETVEDILNSYKEYSEIDLNEAKQQGLQKIKKKF